MANSVIPRGVRYPIFEKRTITIAPNDVVLNTYTEFYNSGTLDTNYIHLFIVSGSFTATPGARAFINSQHGGQTEAINGGGGTSSAYSVINVGATKASTAQNVQYYMSVKPNSNIAFNVTHIAFPI